MRIVNCKAQQLHLPCLYYHYNLSHSIILPSVFVLLFHDISFILEHLFCTFAVEYENFMTSMLVSKAELKIGQIALSFHKLYESSLLVAIEEVRTEARVEEKLQKISCRVMMAMGFQIKRIFKFCNTVPNPHQGFINLKISKKMIHEPKSQLLYV